MGSVVWLLCRVEGRVVVMEEELVRLKEQLRKMVLEKKNLTDPSVVKVSQQIDRIIVELQKQLTPTA